MLETLKQVMGYESYLTKITEYINGIENTQKLHELIIDISRKVVTGTIPLAAAFTALGIANKKTTNEDYAIEEELDKTIANLSK